VNGTVIGGPANSGNTNLGCMSPFALVGCLVVTSANQLHLISSLEVERECPLCLLTDEG
jgi:hypothetical protein